MSAIKTVVEVACKCCDEIGIHGGRGLIRACYSHYDRAGTLHQWPPLGTWLPTLWRLADYTELRHQRGLSLREAAQRLGISERTAERYEARLKTTTGAAA